ncbi:MAG: ABC transporter permease, partial [Cyanobacteria bacterium P01_D01_bin.2]
MGRYILKRLLQLVPVLLGISLLVFAFLHLIPGDPALTLLGDRATPEQVAVLRERMGLNEPLPLQYLSFLGSLISFDLGESIFTGIPIWTEIQLRWPATFELSASAMLIALVVGIPAGVIAAVRKNSWIDNLTMSGSLLGVSMPVYWLGLLLVYLFAVNLQWLPPSGRIGINAGYEFEPITGFFIFDALV